MAGVLNSFPRDGNAVPITYNGLITTSAQTFTGNNTTVAVPLFTITGAVEVTALYGVITTALGSNFTTAFWRMNDGSTQNDITASSGTTLSSGAVGGVIAKKALVATALTFVTAASAKVDESATANTPFFQNFVIQSNPAATSNVEFVYSTTNTPTSGAITFYIRWAPLATANNGVLGGNVTAL